MADKKKTILAAKCPKCGAVNLANDLSHGVAEWLGDAVKEAIANGDELFITDSVTMGMCKCKKSKQKNDDL